MSLDTASPRYRGLAIPLALPDSSAPAPRRPPHLGRRAAQGLDPAALLKPPADSWPTYHGDYSGQRHSRLTQITPDNVHQLTLAWAFQTGQAQQIKATPILVNGVHLHHDARQHLGDRRAHRRGRSGATPIRPNQGFHIGHRGAAVYKDTVYLTTPDAHLVALDAQDRQGQVERRDRRREAAASGRRTRRSSSAIT